VHAGGLRTRTRCCRHTSGRDWTMHGGPSRINHQPLALLALSTQKNSGCLHNTDQRWKQSTLSKLPGPWLKHQDSSRAGCSRQGRWGWSLQRELPNIYLWFFGLVLSSALSLVRYYFRSSVELRVEFLFESEIQMRTLIPEFMNDLWMIELKWILYLFNKIIFLFYINLDEVLKKKLGASPSSI